ncbi:hypothetical protein AGMMS4952_07070 [Spirochaetia bacterium]|nr:hypothetical protein AGMMS4952_07070 [Spirochaetia bacterium]
MTEIKSCIKSEDKIMVKDDEFDTLCLNYRDLDRGKKEKLVWIGEQLLTIKKSIDSEVSAPFADKIERLETNCVT